MEGRLYKFLSGKIYRPLLLRYLSKERTYKYKDLTLKIKPGVFHPAFYFSSKIFAEFIELLDIKNKSVLDLGSGSGILGLRSALSGAQVTASDISEIAIENIKINASQNNLSLNIFRSDLFDDIPIQKFDYIFINPPYFANDPKNVQDYAWFCGSEFQYYSKLFKQFPDFTNDESKVYMILSDNCDLNSINKIGEKNSIQFISAIGNKVFFEQFIIFELNLISDK